MAYKKYIKAPSPQTGGHQAEDATAYYDGD